MVVPSSIFSSANFAFTFVVIQPSVIAAPVVVATLFADVALGFVGKASPQLPVLFVGISIKNLLGLAVLAGAVAFWPRFFDARFGRALEASERILKLAH